MQLADDLKEAISAKSESERLASIAEINASNLKERLIFVEERMSEMSQAALGQEVRVNELEATIIRLQHEIESKQKVIDEFKAKAHTTQSKEMKLTKKANSKKLASLKKTETQQQLLSMQQQMQQLLLNNMMYNNGGAPQNSSLLQFTPAIPSKSATPYAFDTDGKFEKWQTMKSTKTGRQYFYNPMTGESRWKQPQDFDPQT